MCTITTAVGSAHTPASVFVVAPGGGIALPIPAGFSAWTGVRPADTLYADRDVTLLRWCWSAGHRGASNRSEHQVSIGVRFGDNTDDILGTL